MRWPGSPIRGMIRAAAIYETSDEEVNVTTGEEGTT